MNFNPAASFAGRRVPLWLQQFSQEPDAALHDLLMGRAALGHLGAAEPSEVLLDWLHLLNADFSAALDTAMAGWITTHWGDSLPEGSAGHAALTAEAWIRACDVIALDSRLAQAAAALRHHFLEQPRFLESLSEGRARDPQGRAWQALARHQTDRSLLPQWWQLCRLPPDQPWRRGACGIDGLLFLPAKNPQQSGGFPYEAAEGLACLGAALWQRHQEGWLKAETAREEWLNIAQVAELAAPFPQRWEDFWRTAQAEPRCQAWAQWIRSLHSNLGQVKARTVSHRADPAWPRRATDLVNRIKNGDASAISEAEKLLDEERRYAEVSGDTGPYTLSAVRFSSNARRQGWFLQALAWLEPARELAPWNEYVWNNVVTCLRKLDRPDVLKVAMEAVKRFPDSEVASTGLAEVLKAQRRLEEAEAQYRRTLDRFPDSEFASNGLAEVLKAQRRLEEAEAQYRRTLDRFPDSEFASNGLAEVLKAQRRLEEAEAQYRRTLDRFPDSEVASTGLAEVLKAQRRLEEAEAQYRRTLDRFPDSEVASNGLAEVLKAQRRLEEAEAQYRRTLDRFPDSEFASNGLAEVLKAQRRLEEAEAQYRRTLDRFPDSEFASNGLAEVLKAQRRLEEAEAQYRRTLDRFPDSEVASNGLAEVLKAQRRLEEAEAQYRRTLDRFPDSEFASNGLAEVLKAQRRLEEAEAQYRRTLDRFPDSEFASNGLAEVLKAQRRLEEAEAQYRRTLDRFPDSEVASNGLAEVLKAQRRLEEAEAQYRRFPDSEFASNGLAEVLKAQRRLEEAEAQYRRTLDRFPDSEVASTGLAEVLKAQRRLEEAEAQYRRTLDRFPDSEFASNGLAEVLKAQRRLEEAEAQYRRTLDRFPDSEVASTGLAEVLKAQRRLEEAEAQYRRTLDRFPDNEIANVGLAVILEICHKHKEAKEYYSRALILVPDNKITRDNLKQLEKLISRLEQKTQQCRQALLESPENIDAMCALAKILYQQRKFDEALDLVEHVLLIAPDHEIALALQEKLPSRPGVEEQVLQIVPDYEDALASREELPDQSESEAEEQAIPAIIEAEAFSLPVSDPIGSEATNALAPPSLVTPSLCENEIQILTADAYLIRCWRRVTGQNASYILPGYVRERAEKLLKRLLVFETDALAVSEAGLLEIGAGDIGMALELLRQAAKRFPGSSRVRYALARAERVVGGLASVPDWKRLARLDARLHPLALLGEGRARLTDEVKDDATADILGALGHCLQPYLHPINGASVVAGDVESARKSFEAPSENNFMGWWAREVHAHLFGARLAIDADHLPSWDQLIVNARLDMLDGLEEDYLGRYAAA